MVARLFTNNTKKISIYSDFKKDLEISPLSADLTVNKDEDAVKESIRNLILTDRGERLMQPYLGGNVTAMLFENLTPSVLKTLQDQIETTINLYEPRAELQNVSVTGNLDENAVNVKITFYVKNVEQPIELDVFLERTR
jgi:phage baseplate assembly protein W